MLPSNPRSGVRGLPNNPSPRSRSRGQSSLESNNNHTNDQFQSSSSSRPGRQPQYLSSNPRPRSRSRPPPVSEFYTHNRPTHSRTSSARIESTSSRRSDDSVSSNGSSLLGRMKLGSTYTAGSSRTSFEEEYQTPQSKKQTVQRDEPSRSLRQTRVSRERPVSTHDEEPSAFAYNVGDGSAIWSRVATVASTLTVSVSKAWASNVPTYSGEETPPGQESRLIRAMKAYHLDKARDPTDLPPWLFDESVRQRPASREVTSDDKNNDYQSRQQTLADPRKPRGLRDIYDAAASIPSIPAARPTRVHDHHIDDTTQPSKATNRLKAMREAKRSALTANAAPRRLPDEVDEHQIVARESQTDDKPKIDRAAPRLGLPSGPRRL